MVPIAPPMAAASSSSLRISNSGSIFSFRPWSSSSCWSRSGARGLGYKRKHVEEHLNERIISTCYVSLFIAPLLITSFLLFEHRAIWCDRATYCPSAAMDIATSCLFTPIGTHVSPFTNDGL